MSRPSPITARDSIIARWDGRWKIAGLFLLGVSFSILQSIWLSLLAFCVSIILVVLARISLRSFFTVTFTLMLGLLPFAITIPLLSQHGWQHSFTLILRGLAVGYLGHIAFASAPPHRTFAALSELHFPRLFALLIQFSYRYAMMLAGEARRVRVAMQVRGFLMRPRWRSYAGMGNWIGSILVRSSDHAETINQAMHARGFDGRHRSLHTFQTKKWDVFGFGITVIISLLFASLHIYETYFIK